MGRFKAPIISSARIEHESVYGKKDRPQIVRRIEQSADDPRPQGCQKPSRQARYRIREGVYRIVYAIEDEELLIYVVKLGHRNDVYRAT